MRTRAFTRGVSGTAAFKAGTQRYCAVMPGSLSRSTLVISAAAINCRMDYSRAAVFQAGAANQVVPHLIACLGSENPVQRHFLRIGTGAAQPFEMTAAGLAAICVQHEMDHLLGKVFVEYLSALKRDRIRTKMIKKAREEK